jgi:hypothetical protein
LGSDASLPILLQFNGFGNLAGIAGSCVNPVNNVTVDCSMPNTRFLPSFSSPNGATMTLPLRGTHDPSSSADSEYLGAKPAVSSAAKEIDGVVQ